MNSIMWIQNESPEIPNTIIIDGEICKDDIQRQKAFDRLLEINQKLTLSPEKRNFLYRRYREKEFSRQANYRILSPGIYLQGCFLNVDHDGRRLPYMYYNQKMTNISDAIIELKDLSKIVGRECNQEELNILLLQSQRNGMSIIPILSITIILILIISTLIFK